MKEREREGGGKGFKERKEEEEDEEEGNRIIGDRKDGERRRTKMIKGDEGREGEKE